MWKIYLIIISSFFAFACTKDKQSSDACKSDNPMQDVSWLKELKAGMTNCTCEMSIIRGTYQGKTVFFIALTDPLCDGISAPPIYDCFGNVVRTFTSEDYQDFYTEVSRDQVLYRCKSTR